MEGHHRGLTTDLAEGSPASSPSPGEVGEWISSVELESQLMTHPAVAEAAVVAVPDVRLDMIVLEHD